MYKIISKFNLIFGKKFCGYATATPIPRRRIALFKHSFIASSIFTLAIAVEPALSQSSGSLNSSSNQIQNFDTNEVGYPILVGGVTAVSLSVLGLATSVLSGKNKQQLEQELKGAEELAIAVQHSRLQNCKPGITQNLDETEERFRTVAAELIHNYHTQALSQAASQFWFSITAASFGFLLIMYTGFTALRAKEPEIALLNTLPGIAIEAVAALFFRQAEGTRKRATELYDRLRSDDRQTQAIMLIESIESPNLRDIVKAQWSLQIAGFQAQPVDLGGYIPKKNPQLPGNGGYDDDYPET
ncbi:TRADD-N-associated membrane domain-containing protein [Calothrix sp. PCC 6303]|uniref:TRADD-N-associated membrane domain-containing protein n=1 Tax=Calothrix sp. PCC 6303 TaxID=1170562 RepID=UPI0002A0018E|nr:hypothetical protein [Calothrix sp. PCC 6303]AFZ00056.1 hypothetical protein Cal6303_0991 [Calothrix sp. PCC 6303]